MAKSKDGLDSVKKGINPKSLANLRPAQPGDIRNPLGGRSHNPMIKALGLVTQDAYCKALSIAFTGTKEELQDFVADEATPMLERFVAQSMLDAFEKNQFQFVERIADRLIGKVNENMNITNNTQVNIATIVQDESDEVLEARLAKIESRV